MSNTKRVRKRPMSEINVVPYIDVMLVLLIIFMITAPLMTQGIKVDLPQAAAEPVDQSENEPLIVSIDIDGLYYLNVGDDPKKGVDHDLLVQRVAAVLRHKPGTPVLVRGDSAVNYGAVVTAMALLQKAGAPSVGLVTDAIDQ
ncbi:MAG: protein TolR [Thiotrichales bacterium]|nr:MAG: protein TolR [Thiotrichales bacterium]PCI12795.1 MAG: protein TolR [Thiotrichales bacterium]